MKNAPLIFVILGSSSVKQRWKDLEELRNLVEDRFNS